MTKAEIATILKSLRTKANITQKEVAESLDKKQQTIASWESGQSQPDANTLFILCDIYGTSVDKAFGFEDENSPASPYEKEFMEIFETLQPVTQKYLMNIAKGLLETQEELLQQTKEGK